MSIPTIIEIALLLIVVFLIGCVIGWFLRTRIFKVPPAAMMTRSASASAPLVAKSAKPTPAQKSAPVEKSTPPEKSTPEPAPLPKSASPAKPRPAAFVQPAPKPAQQKKSKAAKPQDKKEGPAEAGRPEGLPAPREGGKDNLKKIKGVGPKLEGMLNELGIYHFDQIASWNQQTIDWVDEYLSFKGRIDRDQWIKQAGEFSKE